MTFAWPGEYYQDSIFDRVFRYYPCTIIECVGGGYNVEFYDGFKKKLSSSQVKNVTKAEKDDALAIAEKSFGETSDSEKIRPRKSVFKRKNVDNEESEEIEDKKRIMLGQKRKRPPSSEFEKKTNFDSFF